MTSFGADIYRNNRDAVNKYRDCEKSEKSNKYGTDELKMYMRKQKELRRVRAVQEFEERERVLESKKQRLRELDSKCKQIAGKKLLEKKPSSTNSPNSPSNYRLLSQYHTSTHCPYPTTSRSEKSSRSRPNQQSKRSRYDLEAKPSKSSTKLEREAANFIFKEFENIVKRECKNLLKNRHHSLSGSTSATSIVSVTKAPVPHVAPTVTRVVTKVDKNVGTSFTIYEPSPSELPSRIIDSDSQHSDLSSSVIKPVSSSKGCHVLVRKRKPYEIPSKKVSVPAHIQHAAASRIQAAYKSYKVRSILSEAKLLPRGSTAGATVSTSRPTTTGSTVSSSNVMFPSADSILPRKKPTFYKPRAGAGTAEKPYDNILVTSTKKKLPNPILLGVKASPIRPNPEDIPGYIPPPPSYKPLPRAPDLSPRTLPLLRLKTVDEPFPNQQVLDNLDNSQHSLSNTSSPLKLISSISKFQLPTSLAQSGMHHQNSRDIASNLIRIALRQTVGKVSSSKEYCFEEMQKERMRESKVNSTGRVLFSEPKEQLVSKSVRKDSRISGENSYDNFDRENRHRNFEEGRNFVSNRTKDFPEIKRRNLEENDDRHFEGSKLHKEESRIRDNKLRNLEEVRSRISEETRLRSLKEGIRHLEEGIATSPHAKLKHAKKTETYDKIPPPSSLTNGNANPTPFVDLPVPAFSTVLQEKLRLLREEQQVRTEMVRDKSKSPSKRSLTAVSKATEQIKKKIIEAKQILEDYKMELLRSSSASNMSHGDDHDPTYESDFDSESAISQSQLQQNSLFGHDSEILSSLGVDLDRNVELIPRPGEKVVVEERERKSVPSSVSSSVQRSKDVSLESYREPGVGGTESPVVLREKVNGDASASEKLHREPIHFKTSEVLVEEEASDDTEYEDIVETVSRASSNLPTEDVVYETDFDTDLQSSLSKRHRSSVGASQKDFSLMVDLEDKEATQDSFSVSTGTDPVDHGQEQPLVGRSLEASLKIDQASQVAKEVLHETEKSSEISLQSKLSETLAKSLEFSENVLKSLKYSKNNQKSLENSENLQKSSDISENLQKSQTNSDILKSSPLPEDLQKSLEIVVDLVNSEISEEKSLDISQKSFEMSEDIPMSKLSVSEAKISPKSEDFVSENLPKSMEASIAKSISEIMPKTDDFVSENLPKSIEASFEKSISEKMQKSEISEVVQQSINISENLPGTTSQRIAPVVAVIEEEKDKLDTNASISGISLASNVLTDIGYEDFETDVESQSLTASKKEEKIPSSSIAMEEPMSTIEPKESSTIHTEEHTKQSKAEDSVQPSFLSEQEESKSQPDDDISGKIIEEFSSMSEASNIVEGILDTESIKPEILLEKPTELPPSEISSAKPDRASPPSPKKQEMAPPAQSSDISGISEVQPPSKSPEDLGFKTETSEGSQISQESSLLLSQHSQTEENEKSLEISLPKSIQKEVSTQSDTFLTEISKTDQKLEESVNEKLSRDNFSQSDISLNLPSSDSEIQTSANVIDQHTQNVSGHAKLSVSEKVDEGSSSPTLDIVADGIKDSTTKNTVEDILENISETVPETVSENMEKNQISTKPVTPPEMSAEASEAEFLETLTKTVDPDIIDKIESLIASEISKQMEHEESSESSQATAVEDSRYSSYVSNFHVEDVVYESDFDTDVQSDRSDKSKSKHSSLLETAVKKEVEIMVQNGDLKMEVKTGEGDFVANRPSTPDDPRIKRVLDDKLLLDSLVSRIIARMLKEVSKARNEAFKDPISLKGQPIVEVAESEGSSIQGEVDADAEWFEDDLMSTSAAADDESLKREAAEIVAEQLRIENEIRALEALQAQVPATLLNLSDIPDKPPPPYSPPSSDSLSFSVRSFSVQTSLKDLQELIDTRVDQIWPHYNKTGGIPHLEETSEGPIQAQNEPSGDTAQVATMSSDTDPSITSTRAFNSLLHNLIQDTIKEVLLIEDSGPTAQDYIDKIRPGSLALEAQRLRVPRSKESLRSVVYSKVKNLLPFTVLANHPPAPRKRLTKWTSRPRDLVDEVLAEELIDEDREWTESWPEEILVLDRWAEKFARKALGEVVVAFKTAFT